MERGSSARLCAAAPPTAHRPGCRGTDRTTDMPTLNACMQAHQWCDMPRAVIPVQGRHRQGVALAGRTPAGRCTDHGVVKPAALEASP